MTIRLTMGFGPTGKPVPFDDPSKALTTTNTHNIYHTAFTEHFSNFDFLTHLNLIIKFHFPQLARKKGGFRSDLFQLTASAFTGLFYLTKAKLNGLITVFVSVSNSGN